MSHLQSRWRPHTAATALPPRRRSSLASRQSLSRSATEPGCSCEEAAKLWGSTFCCCVRAAVLSLSPVCSYVIALLWAIIGQAIRTGARFGTCAPGAPLRPLGSSTCVSAARRPRVIRGVGPFGRRQSAVCCLLVGRRCLLSACRPSLFVVCLSTVAHAVTRSACVTHARAAREENSRPCELWGQIFR